MERKWKGHVVADTKICGAVAMIDKDVSLDLSRDVGAGTEKRAYAAPALTVFGSVRQLTHGMGGSGSDGNSGMTKA